jgi:hypothetical protein
MFLKTDRPNTSNPAGAYVTRRHSRNEPFGAPVLVRPILATGSGGVDLGGLAADGKTLWIDTFEKAFPDWPRVVQFSIEELPRLEMIANSEGALSLALHGREGATYEIQTSTDLATWTTQITTNSTERVELSPTNAAVSPGRYYRLLSH